MAKQKAILFFCLGNICRSPLAEAVMLKILETRGLTNQILVDSAATSTYEVGNPPDYRTVETAAERGVYVEHTARQLTPADLDRFDLLVGMEQKNMRDAITLLRPDADQLKKFALLRDWDPKGKGAVPDPYYGKKADFELVQDMMERTIPALLDAITGK